MRRYPQTSDYAVALQHPRQVFTVPELRQAILATDATGMPDPVSGSSAVVFEARIREHRYALRCYTRDEASTQSRYTTLSGFIQENPALETAVGAVQWHENAIRVAGDTWPVLQMRWIDGWELGDYVGCLAGQDDRAGLAALAGQWSSFIALLQAAQFGHGDLQHRNVMVDRQRRLRLVDFDGVWCPPLDGQSPPTEVGHDNFQPPGPTPPHRWGPRMDTFPALVIYLALTALSRNAGLWACLDNGENLLFTSQDFRPPFNTKAWDLVHGLGDATVDHLASLLRRCCGPDGTEDKTLAELAARGWWERPGIIPAALPGTPAPARLAAGSRNWWEAAGAPPSRHQAPPGRQPQPPRRPEPGPPGPRRGQAAPSARRPHRARRALLVGAGTVLLLLLTLLLLVRH